MLTITEEDLQEYRRKGYWVARGLFSREDFVPLLIGIDRMLCAKYPSLSPSGPATIFDDIHEKILAAKREDRARLAAVYDAIRKLAPFWSLIGSPRLCGAVERLLGSQEIGIHFRGCGIRLDLPQEDEWRSFWHQEYHSQMGSMNAVVAWFNLVSLDEAMGLLQIAEGSHREGLLPVECLDPMNQGKNYTKTFVIPEVEAIVGRYPVVSFETEPGDVVFVDFFTLHQSGYNRSGARSRITSQVRYFDAAEPTGISHDWKGGWYDGGDFTRLHPDKVLRSDERS